VAARLSGIRWARQLVQHAFDRLSDITAQPGWHVWLLCSEPGQLLSQACRPHSRSVHTVRMHTVRMHTVRKTLGAVWVLPLFG
jgi:hypothetical protein